MTAIVTDINEYRAKKNAGDSSRHFSGWSDDRIQKQYTMLSFIKQGHDELIDPTQAMTRLAFPNGFDPVNHPEDNIDTVFSEGVRRGVFVTSE